MQNDTLKYEIVPAVREDVHWLRSLWFPWEHLFGAFNLEWASFWKNESRARALLAPGEHWVVVKGKAGFAHFNCVADGTLSLHEIAVCTQRQGIGTALWEHMCSSGRPILLKTDAENTVGRQFYERQGCVFLGYRKSSKGTKNLAMYAGGRKPKCAE